MYIINKNKEEHTEFFNQKTLDKITDVVKESIEIESRLLDWIFEKGELEFVKKEDLLNFMKYRADESLTQIGFEKVFNVPYDKYEPLAWFENEVFSNSMDDFFAKRPVEYTKHDKSITALDLF